jgi:glycosyltransferase involved in cell wall biosynthesis
LRSARAGEAPAPTLATAAPASRWFILFVVRLSVVIITHNEEVNIARTLNSVAPLVQDAAGEVIVVDSGSTDRTVDIAKSLGANVFVEPWKGFAAQKNSAIDKASGEWILSLDADEELSRPAQAFLSKFLARPGADQPGGVFFSRRNYFLGRWIRHGGFYPDKKLRLFRRGNGRFEDRLVHEDVLLAPGLRTEDPGGIDLIHRAYPTFVAYLEHMNRYSSLGAEMAVEKGRRSGPVDIVLRPMATFFYNYFFRLGFLDGREGLLLHLSHSVYVFWKYTKVWELTKTDDSQK